MEDKWIKAHLGTQNVWVKNCPNYVGPLAYPSHCRDGELVAFFSESYAHNYGDVVSRYGAEIGTPKDIKLGWIGEAVDE